MSGGTRCNVLPLEADLSVGGHKSAQGGPLQAYCCQPCSAVALGALKTACTAAQAAGLCSMHLHVLHVLQYHQLPACPAVSSAACTRQHSGNIPLWAGHRPCLLACCCLWIQLDYFTSSSRSALRAVFASWTLDECHAWLSSDVGLKMVLEQETLKWFPASNSGREVRCCACSCPCARVRCMGTVHVHACSCERSGSGGSGPAGFLHDVVLVQAEVLLIAQQLRSGMQPSYRPSNQS